MDGEEIVVDSLVLDVTVRDKSQGETSEQKISALQKALAKFERTVVGLDVNAFKAKFSSMATAIKPLVNQLKKAEKGLTALAKVLKNSSLSKAVATVTKQNASQTTNADESKSQQPIIKKAIRVKRRVAPIPSEMDDGTKSSDWFGRYSTKRKNPKKEIKEIEKSYGDLIKTVRNANGTQTQYFQSFEGNNKIISQVTSAIDEQGKVIQGTAKLTKQTLEDIGGDSLKSFVASIRRIGLYRAIRTLLKFVTQSIEESIKNLSAFDAQTRRTMSELQSSVAVIKNSIGLIIMPLLELAAPILRVIAQVVGTVANAVSRLVAALKGESTWTKINTDYLKEFNKQAKLLSFDEFSVLNDNSGISGMFEEVTEGLGTAKGILSDIAVILGGITGIMLLKWIMEGGLKTVGDGLKSIGKNLDDVVSKISPLFLIVEGIAFAIQAITDIINWDETTTALQKVFNILTLIAGVVAVVAGIVASFLPTGAAKIAKAIGFAGALVAGISGVVAMTQHADGGMFEGTGTIYHQAGEAGPEIVATGSRGTGVVNIDQFKVAMIEALSEYNAARNSGPTGDLIVQLDGKEIARSQVSNNAAALMQRYNIVLKPR